MRKIYIGFTVLLVIGIAAGVYYLQVVRPGSAELPTDVVMENAFDGEYDFAAEEDSDKVRLIEFMYTDCPDICPITTVRMSELRHKFIKEGVFGDEVEFLTITIDPKHDTKEVLQDYAQRYEVEDGDDGWKFLRASEEDTKKVADSLDFLYRDPGTGDIVHTAFTYFIDKDNNLIEKFAMGDGFDIDKVYRRIMNSIK